MPDRSRRLLIGTWNIGGGILDASHRKDVPAQLGHHIARLRRARPDILCLQESHTFHDGRVGHAQEIAKALEADWCRVWPLSPSHLASDADLSLAVVSGWPLSAPRTVTFPNPGLTATGPDGDHWSILDKGYMIVEADVAGRTVRIANAHCFPFHYFGTSAAEPRFASLWDGLAEDLLTLARSGPTLVAIDLNHQPVENLLRRLFETGVYRSAVDGTPTTPKGVQQDYILYAGADLRLSEVAVIPSRADHHYVQALFELTGATSMAAAEVKESC
ncbi:endonuclease/exonuclease/phosphatase family protein [Streptomyces sp. NPDC019990]|uniref:endonuclease/exonuclease/phosphatase family protein n=1 Tax=Streptomyces sp. NPDC019990 TaxID=3154693 RepID=UPI003402161B